MRPQLIPIRVLVPFDVTTVDFFLCGDLGSPCAVPVHWALEDVNGDGRLDLLLRFHTPDIGIRCGYTPASIIGETFPVPLPEGEGFEIQPIRGIDTFRTVGCNGK